jgi:hypothetical protein
MLQELRRQAIQAHNWTSFDPEKRGEQLIDEFTEVLKEDLQEISASSEETKQNYINKFKSLLSAWLGAKSRCFSAMITGPANFPTRRHEKANRSEENKYQLFAYWRGKAKKAILKRLEPEKTFISEIDRYKKELASRLFNQQLMKDSNKVLRNAKGKDCTEELIKCGLSEANAKELQQPDRFGGLGFAQFNMTNNLASIHRIEGRIKELEAKETKATSGEAKEFSFNGGKVIFNYSLDRLQIMHDTKPQYETISKLKHSGFHWSPFNKAWQRQITNEAIYKANLITGLQISI